jgi:signal transduction histidine kinase
MLYDFLLSRRDDIVARISRRLAAELPRAPAEEVVDHLDSYVDQVIGELGRETGRGPATTPPRGDDVAAEHGRQRERQGMDIGRVVHEFGLICDTMAALAVENGLSISAREWQVMNEAIDDGISAGITEYWERRSERDRKETAEHIGFVVHELRNALGGALTALDAIRMGRVGLESRTGKVLQRGLSRAADLLNQVSTEVQLLSGNGPALEPVAVASLLEQVEAAAVLTDSGVQLSSSAEPDLTVKADERMLVSAVSNLVQNAIKFSRRDGHVEARGRTRPDGGVDIEVEDECGGLGRDPDELFRPFVQAGADRSGLGLGLAIVLKIMQAHGGTVRVKDLPGKGCIFTLAFPAPQP